MLQRLSVRVARLEAPVDQDQEPRASVVWLGADGVPEALSDNLTGPVQVIYLPRKSESAELWVQECALRRQQLPEEEPPFDARLRRLEQQARETAWLHREGLAALLAAAKQSPLQSWDLAPADLDDDGPPSGLRRLLEEARQYRQSIVLGS
jgi:hypothetical protein